MSDDPQGSPPVRQSEDGATKVPPENEVVHQTAGQVEKSPMGRPTTYSDEIAENICQRLSSGEETLTGMCRLPGMPSRDTVYGWLETHPHFSDIFQRAQQRRFHAMGDEVVELADRGGDRAALQIRTRMWLLSRLLPNVYGEKIALGIGTPPVARTDSPVIDHEPEPAELDHALGGQIVAWKRRANGSGA